MKIVPSKFIIVLMLSLLLLVLFLPIKELSTSASVDQETPTRSLSGGLQGIEFPAVRQQLQKMELIFQNVCALEDLGDSDPRLLVSTTLDQSIGGIQIVLIENRLSIFSQDGNVLDSPLRESVDNDCGISIVIENSVLSVSGKESIELSAAPKFSLLVVDGEMLNSGLFSAVLTTHVFGTQLGMLAALIRFACFFTLIFFVVTTYLDNAKRYKTDEHA